MGFNRQEIKKYINGMSLNEQQKIVDASNRLKIEEFELHGFEMNHRISEGDVRLVLHAVNEVNSK